jgi:hypothetical protein
MVLIVLCGALWYSIVLATRIRASRTRALTSTHTLTLTCTHIHTHAHTETHTHTRARARAVQVIGLGWLDDAMTLTGPTEVTAHQCTHARMHARTHLHGPTEVLAIGACGICRTATRLTRPMVRCRPPCMTSRVAQGASHCVAQCSLLSRWRARCMLHVASCCLHAACDMLHVASVSLVRTAATMLWHRGQEDSHYIEDTGANADDMAAQVAAYQVGSLHPTSAPGLGSLPPTSARGVGNLATLVAHSCTTER